MPRDQRRNGSAGRELTRFSPPGCGAERGVATQAGNSAHLSPPVPCLRTLSARRRESRRDIRADLSAGGSSPPLPCSGFLGGLRRCPPGRAPFLSPARLPSSPRVAGDSSAHPRGSPLRGAGRREIGRGRAAVDRQKASISQPVLNPSSRDGSGQPQRIKVKGFVTAENREKKLGEEGGRKRGLMLWSIDTAWREITWRSSCEGS